MLGSLAKSIFGSSNDRYVKSLDKVVRQIAAYEGTMQALSNEELAVVLDKFEQALLAAGVRPA